MILCKKSRKKLLFFIIFLWMIIFFGLMVLIKNYNIKSFRELYDKVVSGNFSKMLNGTGESECIIDINSEDSCIYGNYLETSVKITDMKKDAVYKMECVLNSEKVGEYTIFNANEVKNIEIKKEGENLVDIKLFRDDECIASISRELYVIFPYQKQFLDELNSNGISTHFNYKLDDFRTIKFLKNLGIHIVRDDISWKYIEKNKGEYDFSHDDEWIKELYENDMELIAIINNPGELLGDDYKISNDEEVTSLVNFVVAFAKRYPQIKYYEILNEPNLKYIYDSDIEFYNKAVIAIEQELYKLDPKIKILSGVTSCVAADEKDKLSSITYLERILKVNKLTNNQFSIHQYDPTNSGTWADRMVKLHKKLINDYGGFEKLSVTECGITTNLGGKFNEEGQGERLVKCLEQFTNANIDLKILYNSRNIGTSLSSTEHNYGILTNAYIPKKSYYILKNYYTNTNGSEYIGKIIEENLGINVYDKDGMVLLIARKNNDSIEGTIEIPYSGFTAYDLYGNEIENTDGKLSITNSPVYLKNADRSYFYRAISNTAVNAYDEFLTNYSDYLDSSDEMIAVKNKVNQMKKYAAGLATNGEVTEAEALNKMKEHFAIGNMIIDAYKDGKLSCEYVKLSSMLDQLNTTAYAFEDLVTITAKNVSNAKLEVTGSIMNSFDNVVSANSEVEMVYPNKIKAFAKDYYDTSSYINGLEEDNPIKNGLIISKGLHAYYLAEWASSFADCYLQDYEVKIKFSTTDLTNEDVVATLETDAPIELEGSNQYTFTDNGSFTFKYTLNGEEKEITAVVDWIDKDAPVISGIDEREDDMDQVTLNVTDANLDSISLKKDGQDVSFNNGDVLIEVGEYVVIATDLAGNKAERAFKIVDYIESNKTYYISLNGTGDGLSDENPMNVKDVNKTRFYSGDKILFKSGEKYSIDIDCIRKGSPDNRVIISNYGDDELPIINGSISLMSNVDISNLKFTNGAESCLVTNYDFCENVKIENCIFDEVHDTAIYLNRQISNIEITNCIFKNCKSTAIVMKNDSTGFEADKVSINNNVFIDIAKSIEIGSENLDNAFSEIEISKNYFVGQTGSEAIININKIVPDKFEVYIYSNLFYGFDNAYKVITEDENIKKFLVCDYNAFYRYSESNIFNDIKNIADLINRYDNENGSKVVFISKEKYEVEKCLESVSALNSVDKIVEFLSTDVKAHEGEKQLRSYGRTDELIINKVLTADEMKKLNMKVMTDSTVADEKLPLAGWQKVSIAGILIIAVTGLFSAIKYAKFKKDTRKQIRRK